jgi:hypothetical protein
VPLAALLDRHGAAILSAVMITAFAGTDRIAITIPFTIAIAIAIADGDPVRTDPYVGLCQHDQVVRVPGNPCESRERREAEHCRKQHRADIHEFLQFKVLCKRIE